MRNDRGFSLIEVLTGVTVFTLGMLGVAAIQISTINANAFAGDATEAMTLAGTRLELLLQEDFSSLVDTNANGVAGLDLTDGDADGNEAEQGKNNIFDVYWNFANDEPRANCTTIKVIVKWSNKELVRDVSVSAIRSEHP